MTFPKKFIIGSRLLEQLHEYIKDFGNNALLLCDELIVDHVEQEAMPNLQQAGLKGKIEKFNYECTDVEINCVIAIIDQLSANVIVGIGGGKILDTAKAVSYYKKIPVIIFPTIASTDASCTALAVIYKEGGEFD